MVLFAQSAEEIIKSLGDLPLGTIFIWAGLFFLFLTIVTRIGGFIEVQEGQRKSAIVIGLFLLGLGLALSLSSSRNIQSGTAVDTGNRDLEKSQISSETSIENNQDDESLESKKEPVQDSQNEDPPVGQEETTLSRVEVEPLFSDFIEAWNNMDYEKQISLLSEDFISTSYDRGEATPYDIADYNTYINSRRTLFDRYSSLSVEVENPQFRLSENGDFIVDYYQYFSSYGQDGNLAYKSSGNNEVFFRRENGAIKIYKEIFYRDKVG